MVGDLLDKVSTYLGLPCEWRRNTIIVKSPKGITIMEIDTWMNKTMLSGFGCNIEVSKMITEINYPNY